MLGLRLHLLQTFEHAPQVSDAILEGDFLILAGMGIFQQLPHVDLGFLFFWPLVPVRQIVVREMGDYYYFSFILLFQAIMSKTNISLLCGFQQGTEIQVSLVLSSIPVCMEIHIH